jgi:hypothetical protein
MRFKIWWVVIPLSLTSIGIASYALEPENIKNIGKNHDEISDGIYVCESREFFNVKKKGDGSINFTFKNVKTSLNKKSKGRYSDGFYSVVFGDNSSVYLRDMSVVSGCTINFKKDNNELPTSEL